MKTKRLLSALLSLVMIMAIVPFTGITASAATKISNKKVTLYIGESKQLEVKGTNKKVNWSSSNKKVASVTKTGKVKGKKEGTTTVTAKVGKKTYTCKVTVKKTMIVSTTSLKFTKNNTQKAIKVTFAKCDTNIVNWESTDTSVVSGGWRNKWVDKTIILYVYAWSNGDAKITITNSFNKEKVVVNVNVHEPTAEEIAEKQAQKLKIKIDDKLPLKLNNYRWDGGIEDTYKITDISYDVTYRSYDDTYDVKLYFTGEKTYDYRGQGQSDMISISYKLYKDDYVIESGTCYTSSIAMGEKFYREESYIWDLKEPGNYTLKIMQTNKTE